MSPCKGSIRQFQLCHRIFRRSSSVYTAIRHRIFNSCLPDLVTSKQQTHLHVVVYLPFMSHDIIQFPELLLVCWNQKRANKNDFFAEKIKIFVMRNRGMFGTNNVCIHKYHIVYWLLMYIYIFLFSSIIVIVIN